MINSLDIEEISKGIADVLRVRTQWLRVDLSSEDITNTVNFVTELLSKYADDKNILNKQFNPATNETEEVTVTNRVALKDE